MMASRGMGAIRPELKKPKTIKKRDGDEPVELFSKGGQAGLYANIHAKRARIAAGSGERMRKPGNSGAPTEQAFIKSAKTARYR